VVLPALARSLAETLDQRRQIAAQAEEALRAHPLYQVLTSMLPHDFSRGFPQESESGPQPEPS
jgi:hypothetical protein